MSMLVTIIASGCIRIDRDCEGVLYRPAGFESTAEQARLQGTNRVEGGRHHHGAETNWIDNISARRLPTVARLFSAVFSPSNTSEGQNTPIIAPEEGSM